MHVWVHLIFLCVAILASVPQKTSAQVGTHWTKVFQTPPPDNEIVGASFFFNEQRGLIGTNGIYGIYRTSNGGATWTKSIIPAGYQFTSYVSDIFMTDSLNGWATMIQSLGFGHNLWRTTDAGASWVEANAIIESGSSVYETPRGVMVTQRDKFTPTASGFFFSGDKANSFYSISMKIIRKV